MNYPFQITKEELKVDYMRIDSSPVYIHRNAEKVLSDNGFFRTSGNEFSACELNEFGLEVILSRCNGRDLRLVIPAKMPAKVQKYELNLHFTD